MSYLVLPESVNASANNWSCSYLVLLSIVTFESIYRTPALPSVISNKEAVVELIHDKIFIDLVWLYSTRLSVLSLDGLSKIINGFWLLVVHTEHSSFEHVTTALLSMKQTLLIISPWQFSICQIIYLPSDPFSLKLFKTILPDLLTCRTALSSDDTSKMVAGPIPACIDFLTFRLYSSNSSNIATFGENWTS